MKNNKFIRFSLKHLITITACALVLAFGIGYWVLSVTTIGENITIGGTIIQEGWHEVAVLSNGWIYYGAPYNTVAYFRDKNGIVHLKGVVKNGAFNVAVFILPLGYRPVSTEYQGTIGYSATPSRIFIGANGNVTIFDGNASGISLDGITFRAAGY